jgi:hypothetical protein
MFDDGFEYGNPEIPQMHQVEKVSEYIRVNIQGLPSVAFGMSALTTFAHEMVHIRVYINIYIYKHIQNCSQPMS